MTGRPRSKSHASHCLLLLQRIDLPVQVGCYSCTCCTELLSIKIARGLNDVARIVLSS